jgi:hypothetical protein
MTSEEDDEEAGTISSERIAIRDDVSQQTIVLFYSIHADWETYTPLIAVHPFRCFPEVSQAAFLQLSSASPYLLHRGPLQPPVAEAANCHANLTFLFPFKRSSSFSLHQPVAHATSVLP